MSDKKLEKAAKEGAKKTAKLIEDLGEKLDKYRVDDTASAKIDEILGKLKELQEYEHGLAERLKAERKGEDDEDDDDDDE